MKHIGLAIALACLMSSFAWVNAQESEEDTYVPRSERDSSSTFTFKGSSKGLVIIDHETGEVTRYTTKRQKALHRLTPEAEENAREAWENRQAAAADYEAQMEAESEAEPEESGSDNASESSEPAEAAGEGNGGSDDED